MPANPAGQYLTNNLVVLGNIPPQQLTGNATLDTGSVDMNSYANAFFEFCSGTFGGTSPTLSAVLNVQESADNTIWSNNATIPSYTLTGAGKQVTMEILSTQLGTGKRYVRLQAVCTLGGTSPTVPVAGLAYGYGIVPRPTTGLADASVVDQTLV